MNTDQRIELIKSEVEKQTGKPCEIQELYAHVRFTYAGSITTEEKIGYEFIRLLPLSLPNKEGWIAVDFIKDKINKLYRSIENMRKYSDFDPGAGNGIEKAEAQIEFCKSLIKEYENQPLPPAPVKIKE